MTLCVLLTRESCHVLHSLTIGSPSVASCAACASARLTASLVSVTAILRARAGENAPEDSRASMKRSSSSSWTVVWEGPVRPSQIVPCLSGKKSTATLMGASSMMLSLSSISICMVTEDMLETEDPRLCWICSRILCCSGLRALTSSARRYALRVSSGMTMAEAWG